MVHASLFSGIGGPEIAAEMMGWTNAFHCEINPFGRRVLEYWYPESKSYEDITKTDFRPWRGKIDILTGGFPCQPFSYAGKRGGRTITAISGRRCSALLTKSGPLGLSVKMLLESPLWWKAGYALTWEARQLYGERVTEFTDTSSARPSPSSEFAETLRVTDIPSSRCLFRLRLSELPTEETESSSLPLLMTPTTILRCESPEEMRARAARNGYANGTKYNGLQSQIMYDERLQGLLPTPTARDEKNPSSPDGERIARKREQGYTIELNDLAAMQMLPTPRSDFAMGIPLESPAIRNNPNPNLETVISQILPTPRANKVTDADLSSPGVANRNKCNLEEEVSKMVVNGILPTPTCNDAINQSLPKSQERRNDSIVKRIVAGEMGASIPKEDGQPFRLSPLFTEEMMGFPSLWTTLPFLRTTGEPNP